MDEKLEITVKRIKFIDDLLNAWRQTSNSGRVRKYMFIGACLKKLLYTKNQSNQIIQCSYKLNMSISLFMNGNFCLFNFHLFLINPMVRCFSLINSCKYLHFTPFRGQYPIKRSTSPANRKSKIPTYSKQGWWWRP